MIHKQFYFGKEGREKIIETARVVGKTLGSTLGPAGRNYFLPSGITNDGRTIISDLRFKDEGQDQASLAFHEIARQQDKDAGDGTTSAIVVGCELTIDLLEKVPDLDAPVPGQVSLMALSRALDLEKDKALAILNTGKVKKVDTLEMLEKVALTAMENKEAAKIIAEAMWQAGKDAYPVLDNGVNEKIEKDVIDGVRWPLKPARIANKSITLENCAVLVVNHSFDQYLELTPLMASMLKHKQAKNEKPEPIVIVAKHFSVPFVGAVAEVSAKTNFPIALVSADFHQDTFEDVAAYVAATCFDTHPKTGKKIIQLNDWKYVGHAKKVIITEKDTTFIGGQGKEAIFDEKVTNRVEKRLGELAKQKEEEKDEKERSQIERRMAALSGGIATIYVDAKTDAEKYYLKLKVEDAMNSCRAALNDGVVEGGGKTLKVIAEELGEDSLLYGALMKPYQKIIENNLGQEFDTTDVWDAYAVAKGTIENPVSVVKVLITIEGIVSEVNEDLVAQLSEKLSA